MSKDPGFRVKLAFEHNGEKFKKDTVISLEKLEEIMTEKQARALYEAGCLEDLSGASEEPMSEEPSAEEAPPSEELSPEEPSEDEEEESDVGGEPSDESAEPKKKRKGKK